MILLKKNDINNTSKIEGTSSQIEGANIVDFELKGDTYQQTYEGKNLCFNITNPSNANLKFFINKSISKTFTISFTTNEALNGNSLYLEVDGTSYGNIGGITASANTKVEKTYTLSDTNYQAIQNGTNIDLLLYKNGANFNIPNDGMVENNSTATTYEPYVGGVPSPNPDYPQEIVSVTGRQEISITGKNLFDNNGTMYQKSSATVETIDKGIRATVLQTGANKFAIVLLPNSEKLFGKTLTLSANFNASASNIGRIGIYQINSTGGTVTSVTTLDSTGNKTFTMPNEYSTNAVAFGLLFYANTSGTSAIGDYVDYTNVQLELGSTVSPYEPYIFNTYEVNLGKNLFDKNNANILFGTLGVNYQFQTGETNKCLYIPCKPNTTYTVQKRNDGDTNRFAIASSPVAPVNGSPLTTRIGSNDVKSLTVTTGSFDNYLIVQYYRIYEETLTEQQLLDSIQIEVGSKATSYSSYFTPIKLNKVGTYEDKIYKDNSKWYIEKNTRKLELAINDMNNSNSYPGWTSQTQLKNDVYNGTNQGSLNSYTNFYTNISSYNSNGIGDNFNNQETLYLRTSEFNMTQTEWKSNYPDLVFEILYGVVNNPEIVEITNTELINQLEIIRNLKLLNGENNIDITSSDLVGSYKITYSNWYEFEKILRSGYNIKEDYDRITQKFINGRRKQILSDYKDCIIQLSLGTFDLETTVEYLKMLEDGEYEYYSFNDHDYKRADFLLEERPEIIVANSLKDDDAEIEDFEITLLKAGE